MGLKDGYVICDYCGAKVPAGNIPRGWIIISSGRLKEACVKIRLSYGNRNNGDQSLLESYTKKSGAWCGISCFDRYVHTGRPRGFGAIAMLVERHSRGRRGRPKLSVNYFFRRSRGDHWARKVRRGLLAR